MAVRIFLFLHGHSQPNQPFSNILCNSAFLINFFFELSELSLEQLLHFFNICLDVRLFFWSFDLLFRLIEKHFNDLHEVFFGSSDIDFGLLL